MIIVFKLLCVQIVQSCFSVWCLVKYNFITQVEEPSGHDTTIIMQTETNRQMAGVCLCVCLCVCGDVCLYAYLYVSRRAGGASLAGVAMGALVFEEKVDLLDINEYRLFLVLWD